MYAQAGADAVLVHSKAKDFAELAEFGARWSLPVPLVAVPTTYPDVSLEELAGKGFRLAIFANQPLRAAIVAMRDVLHRMRETGRISSVERDIVPLEEVYRLVGVPELKANEKRFLFAGPQAPKAIILAAGTDTQTCLPDQDGPRVMLDVKGKTILERQVESLQAAGIRDVTVVRGYMKDQVVVAGATLVDNDRYLTRARSTPCSVPRVRSPGRSWSSTGTSSSSRRCSSASSGRAPTSPSWSTVRFPISIAPGMPPRRAPTWS